MADAVTTNVVYENRFNYVVHLTNIGDGTGESGPPVVKVDKSAIGVAKDGGEPASLEIEQVSWNVQGFTSVRILWDHTTDDVALTLNGSGYLDFRCIDKSLVESDGSDGLSDPRSSGGTGDILLETNGGAAGATYNITLWLKKTDD